MRTVELFAGIGGFRVAADAVGFKTVWANDSDAKACAVYRSRFGPDGVVEADLWDHLDDVPPHDVLTAGFPCQPFSSAGKKQGVRDVRGTLFDLIVRVLRARCPEVFLLENVKRLLTMERGSHFATILAALTGLGYVVEWRLVNAMDLGLAQNRQRVVLAGRRGDLDDEPRLLRPGELAAGARTKGGSSIRDHGERFPFWGLAAAGHWSGANPVAFFDGAARARLHDVLEPDAAPEYDFTAATLRWLGNNTPVNRMVQGVEVLSNQGGGARMGYTIFGVAGVAPTLTSTTSRHYERYKVGERYRRLTPVEYARLQGFPDDWCDAVPPNERYALFGNAVPPPMAKWALGRLLAPLETPVRVRHNDRT